MDWNSIMPIVDCISRTHHGCVMVLWISKKQMLMTIQNQGRRYMSNKIHARSHGLPRTERESLPFKLNKWRWDRSMDSLLGPQEDANPIGSISSQALIGAISSEMAGMSSFLMVISRAISPLEQRAFHVYATGVSSLAVCAAWPSDKTTNEVGKLITKVDETKEEIVLMREQMNMGFEKILRAKEERLKEKDRKSVLSRIVKFFL